LRARARQAGRGGGGGLSAGSARNHLGNDPGGASASLRRRAAAELLQAAATYGELAAALRRAHGSHVFVTLETEPAVTEALAKARRVTDVEQRTPRVAHR